jgi:Holliday junction resolvase
MRRAKVDANQARIVGALRQAGCRVQHLHTIGRGCPDLLVLHRGMLILVEVKDGDKPPSAQRLTPDEMQWHTEWQEAPLYILRRVEDIPAMLEQVQKDWQL